MSFFYNNIRPISKLTIETTGSSLYFVNINISRQNKGEILFQKHGNSYVESINSATQTFINYDSDETTDFFLNTETEISSFRILAPVVSDIDLHKFNSLETIYITAPTPSVILPSNSHVEMSSCTLNTPSSSYDFSGMHRMKGNLELVNNNNLNSIIFPSTSEEFSSFIITGSDNLTNLNLSSLTGLGGIINITGNINLETVTFPTTDKEINVLDCSYCNLKDVDLSTLTNLGGEITFQSNTGLTSLTLSLENNTESFVTSFCDIRSLNLSSSTSNVLGGRITIGENKLLNAIILPPSNKPFIYFKGPGTQSVPNISLTSIDLSPLTGLGNLLFLSYCTNLETVILPATSHSFSGAIGGIHINNSSSLGYINFSVLTNQNNITIGLANNSMSSANINHILVDLVNAGGINGHLNITGNDGPDSSSGGYDGIAAVNTLTGTSGWDISV